MKIEPQSGAELSEFAKAIEPMTVAMLTHRDAKGVLVSRPMLALEMDRHGALWFATALSATPVEQLAELNLSFSDTERSAYVSLSGRGELHADRGRITRLLTESSRAWHADGPGSRNLALLKFVTNSAQRWDVRQSQMVQIFAIAAPVMRDLAFPNRETLFGLTAPAPKTTTAWPARRRASASTVRAPQPAVASQLTF